MCYTDSEIIARQIQLHLTLFTVTATHYNERGKYRKANQKETSAGGIWVCCSGAIATETRVFVVPSKVQYGSTVDKLSRHRGTTL